ncbi:hypothetical protein DFH08DRAFT_833704 [Mycena albidolilacea]|uniref:Uncharacterized protein n=1 Tax=Mycena albidolilacea TaxID=1033008 RepID=A0AAD7ARK0_9AGAR|nr:hypothetical protein DFH08DRAFT_833704 [Mycena albidolilacea]
MSRVYKVRGLPTQAADTAALVLFYSPAAAGAGTRYVPKSTPSLLPRVPIPAFLTSVFQPCQAVFHEGEPQRSKKLADISTQAQLVPPASTAVFRRARHWPQQLVNGFLRLSSFRARARVVAKTTRPGASNASPASTRPSPRCRASPSLMSWACARAGPRTAVASSYCATRAPLTSSTRMRDAARALSPPRACARTRRAAQRRRAAERQRHGEVQARFTLVEVELVKGEGGVGPDPPHRL